MLQGNKLTLLGTTNGGGKKIEVKECDCNCKIVGIGTWNGWNKELSYIKRRHSCDSIFHILAFENGIHFKRFYKFLELI
jgi:hypothetical protein